MIEALGTGLLLGSSAGLAPGPLLALVIAQTARHGFADGLKVASAPLVTDLPIVVGALLLVGSVAAAGTPMAVLSIAGAVVVAHLALGTWRAPLPTAAGAGPSRSLLRGVVVNLTSPHPYLFWIAVGAPALLAAASRSIPAGLAFVVGFYGTLVGAKIAVAWATARAGGHLNERGYGLLMRVIAVALVAFAGVLLAEGLGGLGLV